MSDVSVTSAVSDARVRWMVNDGWNDASGVNCEESKSERGWMSESDGGAGERR